MPLSKYYKGDGKEVMSSMQKRYGKKKGKSVFYATANARPGMNRPNRYQGTSSLQSKPGLGSSSFQGQQSGVGLSPKAASLGAKELGQSKAELGKRVHVKRKPKKKVRSARARKELARDPGDLVLSGKGTRAQERKRDPRGYLA